MPAAIVIVSLVWVRAPDVLVTGDGRSIGITGLPGQALLVLREGYGTYTRDTMLEGTGMAGPATALPQWPGARCSPAMCELVLDRGGRSWRLLMLRGVMTPEAEQLTLACARADIVIAPGELTAACHPAMVRADQALLSHTGGLALDLTDGTVTTVAQTETGLPWWRAQH